MKSLTFFLVAFVFSLNIFADTVSDKEKEALVKLYNATNGSQWATKWDLSLSVSRWRGVKVENGKVVELNLANNNLHGSLPNEITDLMYLEVLDVSKNKLSGDLPADIGKLGHLEILSLFNNEIKGHIPSSLYKISALKILLLNNNKLSGILSNEIVNFVSLENLSLFDNGFEGEIPKGLNKLHKLTEMNLSYNNFKGTISRNLALLDALNMTMFDESGNPFLLEINNEKETTIVTQN